MGYLYSLRDISLTLKPREKKGVPVEVFKNLSLEFAEGEFTAIVGPSGSGKTTLLKLLEGFLKPDEGEVVFRGNDLALFSQERLLQYRNHDIGMVFQFFNLIPLLTVLENVAMPALIAKKSKDEAYSRATGLLSQVGLEGKLCRKPTELSGGEQQRVAIARALMNNPAVILADEPTGNLDKKAKRAICELFCQINREMGVTLIVVTHDEGFADSASTIVTLG